MVPFPLDAGHAGDVGGPRRIDAFGAGAADPGYWRCIASRKGSQPLCHRLSDIEEIASPFVLFRAAIVAMFSPISFGAGDAPVCCFAKTAKRRIAVASRDMAA